MTRLGLALVVLPLAWWLYDVHHDPCGVTGEAWQQCRAHHQHIRRNYGQD